MEQIVGDGVVFFTINKKKRTEQKYLVLEDLKQHQIYDSPECPAILLQIRSIHCWFVRRLSIILGYRAERSTEVSTMAPTGRVGLGRMDAALDAMRPMGFPEDLVRDKIRQLLKVYGGDEGWAFIEEASYKVLLDAILEPEEESEEGEAHCDEEAESQVEHCDEAESQVEHCDEAESQGDHSIMEEKTVQEAGVKDHPRNSHSQPVHSPCCSISQPPVDTPRADQRNRPIRSPSPLDIHVHSASIKATPPVSNPQKRKRRPCYGWISSDDEQEILTLS